MQKYPFLHSAFRPGVSPRRVGPRLSEGVRARAVTLAGVGLPIAIAVTITVSALLGAILPESARAADHNEAPGTMADPAADITDVYAWHTATELVAVLGFAGVSASETAPVYDDDVLYGIHIDNDGDFEADHDIRIRFGRNGAGQWGVQVENLPGATGTVSGPVGTNLDAGGGLQVYAGWREDPFFFDLEGFRNTLQTGALSFDSDRDSFAGLNVTAIVLEMDRSAAAGSGNDIHIWATTARK